MKLGLACYEFRNGDVEFNLSQIERAMKSAAGEVDLLCFGESFLQGFDALSWNFETDKEIAVSRDSAVMGRLLDMTVQYGVDLLVGYLEREGEALYSSCAVLERGKLLHNYRRVSKNWKEYEITDHHYREGDGAEPFTYRGRSCLITLCGDMWICPERFRARDLLIWPVYVNFSLEEWPEEELAYARQALLGCGKAVMINSITKDPPAHGNAFLFENGKVAARLGFDREGVLAVEV